MENKLTLVMVHVKTDQGFDPYTLVFTRSGGVIAIFPKHCDNHSTNRMEFGEGQYQLLGHSIETTQDFIGSLYEELKDPNNYR